jgi:subtilisin family serine protease
MKKYFLLLPALIMTCSQPKEPEESRGHRFQLTIPGEYLVLFNDKLHTPLIFSKLLGADKSMLRDSMVQQIRSFCDRKNIVISDSLIFTDVNVGFAARLTMAQAESLEVNDTIGAVMDDFFFTLADPVGQRDPMQQKDPMQQTDIDELDIIKTTGGCPWSTCAVASAGGSVTSTSSKKIYIVDTGVDMENVALNILRDESMSFVETEHSIDDKNGHGTHVAGIAAARKLTLGKLPPGPIFEVCGGVSAGAPIVSLKVLDKLGVGKWSYVYEALDHLADVGLEGDIVNLSLGAFEDGACSSSEPEVSLAINRLAEKGLFIVMAAGNDAADASHNLPGCINGRNIFTVGSIGCGGQCSLHSNFSSSTVDWVAVGENIVSTYKTKRNGNVRYATMSGTSMSAAVVSGIIHANNGPPESAGTVTCNGETYQIARRH